MSTSDARSGFGALAGLGERIGQIVVAVGMSQREFAARVGISAGHLSAVIRGRKVPGPELLLAIRQRFRIDLNWLLTGQGDPVLTTTIDFETLAEIEAEIELALLGGARFGAHDAATGAFDDVLRRALERAHLTAAVYGSAVATQDMALRTRQIRAQIGAWAQLGAVEAGAERLAQRLRAVRARAPDLPTEKRDARSYSLADLVRLALPGMPTTKAGWHRLVVREQWPCRVVNGRGGKRQLYVPSNEVQDLIARGSQAASLATPAPYIPREPERLRGEGMRLRLAKLGVELDAARRAWLRAHYPRGIPETELLELADKWLSEQRTAPARRSSRPKAA